MTPMNQFGEPCMGFRHKGRQSPVFYDIPFLCGRYCSKVMVALRELELNHFEFS